MKVFEIICWKFEDRSMGLFSSEKKAQDRVAELLKSGELINPLYTIYRREVE